MRLPDPSRCCKDVRNQTIDIRKQALDQRLCSLYRRGCHKFPLLKNDHINFSRFLFKFQIHKYLSNFNLHPIMGISYPVFILCCFTFGVIMTMPQRQNKETKIMNVRPLILLARFKKSKKFVFLIILTFLVILNSFRSFRRFSPFSPQKKEVCPQK